MRNIRILNADFGAGRRQPPGSSFFLQSGVASAPWFFVFSSERGGVSPLAFSNREAMPAISCGRQPAEMFALDCQSREAATAGSGITAHFCRRFAAQQSSGLLPWANAHGYLLPSLCDSRQQLVGEHFDIVEHDWTRRIPRGLRPKSQGADATPLRKKLTAIPLLNFQELPSVIARVPHTETTA